MMGFREKKEVDLQHFTMDINIRRGSVVCLDKIKKITQPLVASCKVSNTKIPIGLSGVDVVKVDKKHNWYKLNTVYAGAKIEIVTVGYITLKFNKSLQLPYGQPIYVDLSRGELSWRKLGPEVGFTAGAQFKDGSILIKFDFKRIG